jgi:hypothetical protein
VGSTVALVAIYYLPLGRASISVAIAMLAVGSRRLSAWSSFVIHRLCVRHLGACPSKIVNGRSQYSKEQEP